MASYHPSITDEQAALIRGAALFFVASADPQLAGGPNDVGPVNVSPKAAFRCIFSTAIAWRTSTTAAPETRLRGIARQAGR